MRTILPIALVALAVLAFAEEPQEHEFEAEAPASASKDDLLALETKGKVLELDSSTFEVETQASTGMTSGSWFVLFYAPWCGFCTSTLPLWDQLATMWAIHATNMAKVNCDDNGGLCRRFEVTRYPTAILFHKKKMYKYESARDPETIKTWLVEVVPTLAGEEIPAPPTWTSEIGFWVRMIIEGFKQMEQEYPQQFYIGGAIFIATMIAVPFIMMKVIPLEPHLQKKKQQNARAPASAAQGSSAAPLAPAAKAKVEPEPEPEAAQPAKGKKQDGKAGSPAPAGKRGKAAKSE
jgi:thioredoxin domain-containing protein 5